MPKTIPAMRGQIGSTEYFLVFLKAGEIANITMPKDVEGWDDLSMKDRWQRVANLNRIKKQIAPYFAQDKDRFSGALIVAMQNAAEVIYEPVKEILSGKGFTGSHRAAADNLGFLTLTDGEVLIPIDGQHRALALKYAIDGKADGKDLEEFRANPDVKNDDIATILIRFDTDAERKKARKIFNKVNRYAKPTTKADNLITDDDDIAAVLTNDMTDRQLFGGAIIHPRLIAWPGTTLPDKSHCFIPLATLYEINKNLLEDHKEFFKKRASEDITKDQEAALFEVLRSSWEKLLKNVREFGELTADPEETGDEARRELRRENLLGKPVGQRVLVAAYLKLTKMKQISSKEEVPGRPELDEVIVPRTVGMNETEAFERLNKINWGISHTNWRGVLTREGNKVVTGTTAIALGADFVVYLAGGMPDKDEQEKLRKRIVGEETDSSYQLPDPIA